MTKPSSGGRAATNLLPADQVEKDFLLALERLQAGKPKDKKLQAAVKAGKLRISVTTVATEAGHSRTLIGHKGCKYPSVRDRIVALKADPANPTRLQDIVAARRQDVARLSRELKLSQSQVAALVVRNIQLEQEVARLKRVNERKTAPNALPPSKVMKLRS